MHSDVLQIAAPTISDSAVRRAIQRISASPLHLGDWLLALVTVAVVVTCFALLTQVLNAAQGERLAWTTLVLGAVVLAGGTRLRALEAAIFNRAPGPRDTLVVVANGAVLVLCALAMLLPKYA